jgi:hypothetical protein
MTRPPRRLCKYLSGPLRLTPYFRGLYTSSVDERDWPGSMAARATVSALRFAVRAVLGRPRPAVLGPRRLTTG